MPSRIHAKSADVFVDEFDFSGVTNSCEISLDVPTPAVTAFGDTDETYVQGKAGFTITVNGLHSLTSPAYDGEMFADLTSEGRRLGIYPNAATTGEFGYEGDTNISAEPIMTRLNEAIVLNVSWKGDTPIIRTQSFYRSTAIASTATGTAYNTGAAAATDTIFAIVRLLAAPGGAGENDLIVTIESDDQEAFAGTKETQLTFTTIDETSVALSEVKEAAGAVTDDWWRAVLTVSGVGSRTFNILVAFGIRPT